MDHLAGKKHRASVFRLKTERKLGSVSWRQPIIIDDDEVEEQKIPQVKREAAEILASLSRHSSQAQCRLNFVGAAAILLVVFVLSSTWWITGVKAEEQASKAAIGDQFSWTVAGAVLIYLVMYLCDLALQSVKTYCRKAFQQLDAALNARFEPIVARFESRVDTIGKSVADVPVQIQAMSASLQKKLDEGSVNIEQAVAGASAHAAIVIEEKIEQVERKISAVAQPMMDSAKTGMSVATWIALLSAVWYLCRSLFVKHAEKRERDRKSVV